MTKKFTILIEKDEDGILVAKVTDLPGCHTQAKTLRIGNMTRLHPIQRIMKVIF